MTALEFIADLVSSLAWPASLVLIALIFREPLRNLIPLLRRLKYRELEIDFDRRLEDLGEVAEELEPAPEAAALPPSTVAELAKVSPRSAVIESWRAVEHAAVDLAHERGVDLADHYSRNPFRVIRALEKSQTISPSTSSAIHELRSLRNDAAHAPEFSLGPDSALAYDAMARRVISSLRSSSTGPPHDWER